MTGSLHIIKPSVNSMCVRILIRAASLDITEVDAYGKTRTDEFLGMCPAHLTPFLQDSELLGGGLWEGGAIMQYLCNRHGLEQFYPTDAAQRARQDSALLYVNGSFYPLIARTVYPLLGFPLYPGEVGASEASDELKQAARLAAENALAEPLEVIQKCFLAGADFFGGSSPSIADFRFGSCLEFLPAANYAQPDWARAYTQRMEDSLGAAYLEPAADVRGFLAYVKSQAA